MKMWKQTAEQATHPEKGARDKPFIIQDIPEIEDGIYLRDFKFVELDNICYGKVRTCRKCLEKIKPYTKKYFLKKFTDNEWVNFEHSQETFFCEKCAIEETSTVYSEGWNPAIEVVAKYNDCYRADNGGAFGEVVYFADGGMIEPCKPKNLKI